MYHSIILEDLLDLINLKQSYLVKPAAQREITDHSHCQVRAHQEVFLRPLLLIDAARGMIAWLKIMCHPDGQITLFNDAAFRVASHPSELYAYAERLGIYDPAASSAAPSPLKKSSIETFSHGQVKLTHLKASGYIRIDNGPLNAILDVAPIGPDYLLAHSHADSLTFEMSLYDQRVIVDSGTSRYDEGRERMRQRGTAAHNTVVIDGKDSSRSGEASVWRRGHAFWSGSEERARRVCHSAMHPRWLPATSRKAGTLAGMAFKGAFIGSS